MNPVYLPPRGYADRDGRMYLRPASGPIDEAGWEVREEPARGQLDEFSVWTPVAAGWESARPNGGPRVQLRPRADRVPPGVMVRHDGVCDFDPYQPCPHGWRRIGDQVVPKLRHAVENPPALCQNPRHERDHRYARAAACFPVVPPGRPLPDRVAGTLAVSGLVLAAAAGVGLARYLERVAERARLRSALRRWQKGETP